MEGAGKGITFADVVKINRRLIDRSGGLYIEEGDNLLNPGSLEHVLSSIQGSAFGENRYPTIVAKAAALAWFIIRGHVFRDGNKRTGMDSCYVLLRLNGFEMRIDHDVVDMALAIAKGEVEFGEFAEWVEARTTVIR